MDALFEIETDEVLLTWSKPSEKEPEPLTHVISPPGRLVIRKRRKDLVFLGRTTRTGVPEQAVAITEQTTGPRLYEYTNYKIYVRAKSGTRVSITHRDPFVERDLSEQEEESVVYGNINFGPQVGRSPFSVLVDGRPEFDFEVEVFPSKLDYASDYEKILAEVQEVMTALAMEYLRSTFQLGTTSTVPQPAHLEWLTLLRHVVEDLETALQRIAQQPVRGLTRQPVSVRAERIKRVDSQVRSAIRRGAGSGGFLQIGDDLTVRQRLQERRARPTLDTQEHRWLATQLDSILRRLVRLRSTESLLDRSERRKRTLQELGGLKTKISRLRQLEPMASASDQPPGGFASLQLLTAPGYREAYQACLILALGLRIEGGPMQLSVKDLNLLYEYWCYLALLRIISEETGQPIPTQSLFAISQQGLRVLLQKGKENRVCFDTPTGRSIRVTYNPLLRGESFLIPQQPDVMITFEDPDWPRLHLILDAKYRVDASSKYKDQYNSPGPPQDALNVMHRYRDAILESDQADQPDGRPKRTVVQAAAAFPFRESFPGEFGESRLWQALDRLGVGAVPLLPGNTAYLREWLRVALHQGGWALADRAIAHRAQEHARDWRIAASESVLIGVLRPGSPQQHLDWIKQHRIYYMPLLKTQRRQYATKWVAIYSPAALRHPGAVAHKAFVEAVEVIKRSEISTPWSSSLEGDALCVVYRLSRVDELSQPIENKSAQRVSTHRWTSRLALDRAKILEELLLETEPEWRFYEELLAYGISFHFDHQTISVSDPDDPKGRVWFIMGKSTKVRYAGASGFLLRNLNGKDRYFAHPDDVVEVLMHAES